MPINDRAIGIVKKSVVLLFAGQGAQEVGMGQSLVEEYSEARDLFDMANEQLGFDLTKKMFEGPNDELTKTTDSKLEASMHHSDHIEFNSPFFLMLKALLQPFFFVLGITNSAISTISPQQQKHDAKPQRAQPHNTGHEFAAKTFINNEPLTAISTLIIEEEQLVNTEAIETILLGPGQ